MDFCLDKPFNVSSRRFSLSTKQYVVKINKRLEYTGGLYVCTTVTLPLHTVEPAKSNHPGEIPKMVARCRWLLFAGSVMGYTLYVY